MAIKTVNADNLAEYAASRPNGGQIAPAGTINPESGVKGEATETISTAPDPGKQPEREAKKSEEPKDSDEVKFADPKHQARWDKLTRLRKDAEDGWEAEYEHRLRLEGELSALKSKPEAKQEQPKEEAHELPDPTKYTDQGLFLKDYAEAVEKRAASKFVAEQQKAELEKRAREADAAMVEKIARAKTELEDFDDVIDAADKRTRGDIPNHIKAAIYESEYGAHIAYELAKDAALEKRISAMSPARALLELGKLETKWAKKEEKSSEPKPPESLTPKPPEPISKLKEGSGIVQTDLSQPMPFKDYRRGRLEQLRERRR